MFVFLIVQIRTKSGRWTEVFYAWLFVEQMTHFYPLNQLAFCGFGVHTHTSISVTFSLLLWRTCQPYKAWWSGAYSNSTNN